MAEIKQWHADKRQQYRLKHDRLLRVAAACFNQKGYSGTSLKDVARQLDLTDAALYYYVRNKEELVYQCYRRAADLGEQAMLAGSAEGENGLAKALGYLARHIEAMCGEEGPLAIMSEIPSLEPAHKADILERSRRHSLAFEALLTEGINDGSVAPCDVRMTGNAIMGAVNWIPKWYRPGGPVTSAQVQSQFEAFFRRALQAAQGEATAAQDNRASDEPERSWSS